MAEVAACVKVVPARVEVDALSGSVALEPRLLTVSAADRAAVQVARSLAHRLGATLVVYAVTGPEGAAALRELAAEGADRVVRVALRGEDEIVPAEWLGAFPSDLVAAELADRVSQARHVVCGEHSSDRGSATVPARLAARLDRPQALGLVEVDAESSTARRRLSGGRLERLAFDEGTVLSVEAAAAPAMRGSLARLAAARVEVVHSSRAVSSDRERLAPYRVPARVVEPPRDPVAARRAMESIGALQPVKRREVRRLGPDEAAAAILEALGPRIGR